MIVAGYNQHRLRAAVPKQHGGVLQVLPGVEGGIVHQHLIFRHAELREISPHHAALRVRLVTALRAADHNQAFPFLPGLIGRVQPPLQLHRGRAVGLHLGAQHHNRVIAFRLRHMGFLPADHAHHAQVGNHARKRQNHQSHQQAIASPMVFLHAILYPFACVLLPRRGGMRFTPSAATGSSSVSSMGHPSSSRPFCSMLYALLPATMM